MGTGQDDTGLTDTEPGDLGANRGEAEQTILHEAEQRDDEADARDTAANRRDLAAGIENLLNPDDRNMKVSRAQEASALDRKEAHDDRIASKDDRAKLTRTAIGENEPVD